MAVCLASFIIHSIPLHHLSIDPISSNPRTQTASSVEVPRLPQDAAIEDAHTYVAVLEANFAAVCLCMYVMGIRSGDDQESGG